MSLFPFAKTPTVSLTPNDVTASSIREYGMNFTTGNLTGQIIEGVEALCVWAYLALKAERYKWVIYSWGYGNEVYSLIGTYHSEEYLKSECKRYIEECLLENEYITGVTNLEILRNKDLLQITFTLQTVLGDGEVEIRV